MTRLDEMELEVAELRGQLVLHRTVARAMACGLLVGVGYNIDGVLDALREQTFAD
jgi:hypothetical protein